MSASREARRQQWLLQALLERGAGAPAEGEAWLRNPSARQKRGLQAYVANAGAHAERSLASAYPTVAALLGEESFAGLARAFWEASPPVRGDLAEWGPGLPDFLDRSESLTPWPYLADCARLDGLIALAERAPDADPQPATVALLGEAEPTALAFDLAAGAALLTSRHPVATLWQAHQPGGDLADARAALEGGRGEHALVWREGWRARAAAIDDATARWTVAVLHGESVGAALQAAGEAFDFEHWLLRALRDGWLWRVRRLA